MDMSHETSMLDAPGPGLGRGDARGARERRAQPTLSITGDQNRQLVARLLAAGPAAELAAVAAEDVDGADEDVHRHVALGGDRDGRLRWGTGCLRSRAAAARPA